MIISLVTIAQHLPKMTDVAVNTGRYVIGCSSATANAYDLCVASDLRKR